MDSSVTVSAQSKQILLRIASGAASQLNMVDLQVLHAAASLASPAVSLENLAV